jgi:hypothetical protein
MKQDNGHWEYPNEFDINEYVGFCYLITSLVSGKKYIGKKFFFMTTHKPPLKGKTRKRKVVKESNWKKYTGSSYDLNEEIAKVGKENFKFQILSLHENRSSLAFREIELIVMKHAVQSDKFWNGLIPGLRFKIKEYSDKELASFADINMEDKEIL